MSKNDSFNHHPDRPEKSGRPCESGTGEKAASKWSLDRRAFVVGGGAALAAWASYALLRKGDGERSAVFLARNQKYNGALERTIEDGLASVGFDLNIVCGKKILLKPNLVEPTRVCPHMTTHPMMIAAAASVFQRHGAEVTVGEGPGHVRDIELALTESGMHEVLEADGLRFVDLNYDDVRFVNNLGKSSKLKGFYFPRAAIEADLIVSMPKLKTHHWMGLTVSLKNMYGVIPGCKYGWPKNVLHHAGIPETVFDINASLPKTIAIVDGITCMEGDGPILGSPKEMGIVAIGLNPTAVDATCARIMGLAPERVEYLEIAAGSLGPVKENLIEQRGENWQPLRSPFQILEKPHLQRLRVTDNDLKMS